MKVLNKATIIARGELPHTKGNYHSSSISAVRLPVTTNSEPAPATIRNHGEMVDADRDAAGDRAQHEAGRDGREVEDRFVLQPDAVEQGQREIAGDDERELSGPTNDSAIDDDHQR